MGVERKIHALLNAALHLCEWSPSSCCQFTSSIYLTEGWAGFRTGVTTAEKRRITARLQSPIITALTRLSQLHTIKREERKPTRCNNIDDLLPIVDVDY